MKNIAIGILALTLAGCASVKISPETISSVEGRPQEVEHALTTLRQAVTTANEFLASEYNTTLPKGEIILSETGMTFEAEGVSTPLTVRCNLAGDLILPFGAVGQERSWGFVVGKVSPKEDRELDNTLFKSRSGSDKLHVSVAGLILHELSHVYHELGTVSLWKSLAYYGEAIFLLRYRNHSMERLPYETSGEFQTFFQEELGIQLIRNQSDLVRALTIQGDPTEEELVELLYSSNLNMVNNALGRLRRSNSTAGKERAAELLNHTSLYVWYNAAMYLGSLDDPRSIPYLIRGLDHPAWRSRPDLIVYLTNLTDEDFGEDKNTWIDWWTSKNPDESFDFETEVPTPFGASE